MKLKLKEDPKEWRKTAWMSALGLAVLSSLLRWRQHLAGPAWAFVLCCVAVLALAAALQPPWFRGYYRFSMRLGFGLSQLAGRAVLAVLFFVLITPLGWIMRRSGKDSLRLRRSKDKASYWSDARQKSSLDRMF
jgi:hypothetical protein